jgi:hypothetical protein
MGPHHYAGDAVRYWVEWVATGNPRVLELPAVYLDSRVVLGLARHREGRRESEIDDHGEDYPLAWEGPGLRLSLRIPPGEYTLSLYLYNYNGHSGENRNRDYLASLATFAGQPGKAPGRTRDRVANCRVGGFWGGVWVRFLVRGPSPIKLRLSRNYSFNTMLAGAMLDPVAQHPAPYYPVGGRAAPPGLPPAGAPLRGPLAILGDLEKANPRAFPGAAALGYGLSIRDCAGTHASAHRSGTVAAEDCYFHLAMYRRWEAMERRLGIVTSREIERGLRWDGARETYRGIEAMVIAHYAAKLRAQSEGRRWQGDGQAPVAPGGRGGANRAK